MDIGLISRFVRHSNRSLTSLEASMRRYSSEKKTSKPLRILFCGSDALSCESLRALHAEQQRDPAGIASIDVLCRPGKRSGRSMKLIRDVPLKKTAQQLNLKVHEIDTFTGWNLPKPYNESINLIIAVSFGLFVPPRILEGAEYGGINVHPSLLPNYRGPAPLHHTILNGEEYSGITLQTLDDKSFDHGKILDQTPPPGFRIRDYTTISYAGLLDIVKPMAATMLVQGVQSRLFIPPFPQLNLSSPPKTLTHAHKIQTKDREVDWQLWDSTAIHRRFRALGSLWSTVYKDDETTVRIKFEDFEVIPRPKLFDEWYSKISSLSAKTDPRPTEEKQGDGEFNVSEIKFMVVKSQTGSKFPLLFVQDDDGIIIAAKGLALRVSRLTAAGAGTKPASKVARGLWGDRTWRVVLDEEHCMAVSRLID